MICIEMYFQNLLFIRRKCSEAENWKRHDAPSDLKKYRERNIQEIFDNRKNKNIKPSLYTRSIHTYLFD